MSMNTLTPFLPLLAALNGGLAIFLLAHNVDLALMLAPAAGRTVAAYAGKREPDVMEKVGNQALARIPLLGTFLGLPGHLRWLSLTGQPGAGQSRALPARAGRHLGRRDGGGSAA